MNTGQNTAAELEYSNTSPARTLLDNRPGERLSREEIRFRLFRRAFRDPSFERELLTNTRVLLSIVYEECLGIDRYAFLGAVLRYPVLHETASRLYMEIPGCHRGCTLPGALPPGAQARTECPICERAFPPPAGVSFVKPDLTSKVLTRRTIEGHIQKRLAWDPHFGRALNSSPLEAYVSYATELCSGRSPKYLAGIDEIRLVEETSSEMYLIFPTHESFQMERDC